MRRNGFEILFSSSYTAILLPLMVASRALGKGQQETGGSNDELAVSPLMNCFLTTILKAEVRMTLAGLRWPAGGSRIVVGCAI